MTAWRTARGCGATECVEVGQRDGMIVLRDSTQPHGTMLRYATKDWERFIASLKADEPA